MVNYKNERRKQNISQYELEKYVNYIIDMNGKISDYIYDTNILPIYNAKKLPNLIEYNKKYVFDKLNCHLGQRKLLLTEIEFYNKCIDHNLDNNLVIYAGSASSEHLPVITKMFPKLKLLLIDPNYHIIDWKYKYVYQNVNVINKKNNDYYKSILNSQKTTDRSAHLLPMIKKLLQSQNIYNNEIDDYLHIDNTKHIKKMDTMMTKFYSKYNNIIDLIMNDDTTNVFIIQDYMTIKLTKYLKKYLSQTQNKLNMYFLTDIRTVSFDNNANPSDLDVIWNSALQVIFVKKLKPIFSMLKFRPPFYDTYDDVVKIYNDENEMKKFKTIMSDINYVKDKYGIDLLGNFINKKYKYFDCDFIYVQPWAPNGSSETRLFISKNNIDKTFVDYDNYEWENKFFLFKFIRMYKYNPIFYEKIKDDSYFDYDACNDCSREIAILMDYIHKKISNDKYNAINVDYDYVEISKNLDDKNYKKELLYHYNLINKFTFFDLSKKNYKCHYHGNIKKNNKHMEFMINNNIIKINHDNNYQIKKK